MGCSISDVAPKLALVANLLSSRSGIGLLAAQSQVPLRGSRLRCVQLAFRLALRLLLCLRKGRLLIVFGARSRLHQLLGVFAEVDKFAVIFCCFNARRPPQGPLTSRPQESGSTARCLRVHVGLFGALFALV